MKTFVFFFCSDGMRESNVVTKIFEVDYVPAPTMPIEDDDLGFQDELNRTRAKVGYNITELCIMSP